MSSDAAKRAELLASLNREFRRLATATILFHQAIADRLGLNLTDHKCAGILCDVGPMTAGELAERLQLTTGAVTGVIDRLEEAGFVRRTKDAKDRRRVIVEPLRDRIGEGIAPLFESMARASASLCECYSTQELTILQDFTRRAQELAYEETRKLREVETKRQRPDKATKREA